MTDGPRRRPRPTGPSSSTRRAPAAKGRAPAKKSPAKRAAATKAAPRTAAAARKPTARRPAARRPAARRAAPARRPLGRIAAGLVVSVVLVGFLLVGVFPTRTWLAQREETKERQAELDRIRAEQAVQEERIAALEDPDEIEAMAREEHGLVMPGEDSFQMLPGSSDPVDLPDAWPFTGADDWLNR